ncbi:flagellar basal body-associated FliL family protein [Ruegeria pomeroyi]|uniref:Flagellar protein FliL n=2 Tax=Ruegeria pomeroyi TaxID=89184 RepID=Q5LWY8_RUEPO|nr:flagellar basal body-associated FliL family protein [Ruegeria pomeroyi]HCE70713.1 flagellar basal body protein FliL [Ruegeria sp.]AAV93526.1 flagellar basal body-associated protein FliL [Ruegeria pomeroyi DSS-3]NVK96590.1 flagellar basal body-associated FliL family protein [Ruegeria pomeroyi]NVL01615.1 flagellar basal body-associated FliL family protein [Ruegeria pomeroyi]QWV10817.1 flagellar basal body-associated FliL family protein [Ruegeria pomeroyi]
MTDATADEVEPEKKSGKKGLIVGLVLALVGAGGGFYATVSGLIPLGAQPAEEHGESGGDHGAVVPDALPNVAYVDLQPIMVSLLGEGGQRHLRFHAQLEVPEQYLADVEKIRPRIVDVLNGYLRAIEISDLSDPLALTRLRGHMQRRINIVAGEGRVKDVLVMEFVLN